MRSIAKMAFGAVILAALGTLPATAAMTGGMAAPPGSGEATMSVSLAYSERDVTGGHVNDQARSRRFLFKGDFGLGHDVDLYAMLGLSDISYRDADFSGNLGEAMGLGFRYSPVTFSDRTKIVTDFQMEYFASDEGSKTSRQQAYHAAIYAVGEFGSAGKAGYFYPFGGVRLSYADYNNDAMKDFRSNRYFGLMAGADLFVNPNVYLSGEFHLFDENAFYMTVGYRF